MAGGTQLNSHTYTILHLYEHGIKFQLGNQVQSEYAYHF